MTKKKVVLYGAYDRYNYGDNLMPILLEHFFRLNSFEKFKSIDFIYTSIDSSNLSNYKCYPTVAMKDLLSTEDNTTIIVVGGEVLGADVGTLYTHVQSNHFYTRFLKALRRYSPATLSKIAGFLYPAVWNYPYIPQKDSFTNRVKIVFNTVGGIPVQSQIKYLKEVDYLSARDQRTFDEASKWSSAELVPDSVLIASKIIDDCFMHKYVREEIISYCKNTNFISVQACPYKIKFSPLEMASELDRVKKETGLDVVLLPIGYASGHDDVIFLREVKALSKTDIRLEYELNVWEIMYFLSHSQSFYGTSLHGIITAMSFGVPHFCINDQIDKITSFVKTWSVEPFIEPIVVSDITKTALQMEGFNNAELVKAVSYAQSIISSSLNKISSII